MIRIFLFCLFCSLSSILVKADDTFRMKAIEAFERENYTECVKLMEEGGMKEIRREEKAYGFSLFEPYVLKCLAISYMALGEYDKALHALTDKHRIIYKNIWIDGNGWTLEAEDLKNWPQSKKPLMRKLFYRIISPYYDEMEKFKRSPLIRTIVQSKYNSFTEQDVISLVGSDCYSNALDILNNRRTLTTVPENVLDSLAILWFQRASNYGKLEAQLELGRRYLQGECVKCDTVMALFYLEKACANGASRIAGFCGNCYLKGNGVLKDYDKAFDLFWKGALEGDRMAIYGVGLCYYYGYGTVVDKDKAVEYLSRIEDWYPDIPYLIGCVFYEDRNKEAVRHFDFALAIPDLDKRLRSDILRRLSACYRFGYCGVKVDVLKADLLFKEAAQYGDGIAINTLERFNSLNRTYKEGF